MVVWLTHYPGLWEATPLTGKKNPHIGWLLTGYTLAATASPRATVPVGSLGQETPKVSFNSLVAASPSTPNISSNSLTLAVWHQQTFLFLSILALSCHRRARNVHTPL